MAAGGYTVREHSLYLKVLSNKLDSLEQDKSKVLIFNMLLPLHKMNHDIFNLTSEYPEFVENDDCFTFLKQLSFLNHNVMNLLNGQPLLNLTNPPNTQQPHNTHNNNPTTTTTPSSSSSSSQTGTTSSSSSPDQPGTNDTPSQQTQDEAPGIPLNELIEFLVSTDIKPIQYDRELLVTQLITNGITNQNVVHHKSKMLSILEDCQFPKNRAEFTMEQIERNLSTQTAAANNSQTTSNSNMQLATCPIDGANSNAVPDEAEEIVDENGINVVDLTQMAVETVYEGRIIVQRADIVTLYKKHDIDSTRLMLLTETEFASMFQEMRAHSHTKQDCVKIHRFIKTLLNVPSTFRYDIDIALAIIYLINEDNTFARSIAIDPAAIQHAFANYSARTVHKMGKKAFIKLLQSQTQIKMGHGTKLWSALKAYIEDCNVALPPQIVIADYRDEEEQQEEEQEEEQTEANGHGSHGGQEEVMEANGHSERGQDGKEKQVKSEKEKDDDYKQPLDNKAIVGKEKEFEANKNLHLAEVDVDAVADSNKMEIDAMGTVKV
eukprot:CAMPEP_0197030598 /NCGR_PEP_ID=MMETSP1384-20130603/9803_1 /TAXON_ID=29189 /ORGANISM="Ammonia sp." /LENGTH=547 /DNA_ID=CAMNT_0042459983 /DNA_START=27 /DNA_END=1670 /DNA_ORIENTATION=+